MTVRFVPEIDGARRVASRLPGQWVGMAEPNQHPSAPEGEPAVTLRQDGDVATLTVAGELTETARRPLVRAMTDLLLGHADLRAVRLDLRAVEFMNSAGTGVLVQLQKLGAPRGVDVVLVAPPAAVVRPLQLTGLWTRFPIDEATS